MANWWDIFWSPPQVDTTITDILKQQAAEAEAAEKARQARIAQGMTSINQGYAKFDQPFYNQRRDDVLNFYQPQLDQQVKAAKDKLTYAFGRAGTLKSSMSNKRLADLAGDYDVQKSTLLSNAEGDVANLRNAVANQKSNLIAQLNATSDASQAANAANAQSQMLYEQRPIYSPLGDIFAGVTQGIGNAANAYQQQQYMRNYFGGGSGGSTRTVT